MSRQTFCHMLINCVAGVPGRTKTKDFGESCFIYRRDAAGITEDSLRLGRKDKCIMKKPVKERLYTKGIPEEIEKLMSLIINGKSENTIHFPDKGRSFKKKSI